MQHEAAKRQAAEARAETADRERKKQARLARAGKAARNQHKEQAGTWKTAYDALVKKHNTLLERCKPWLNLAKLFVKDGLLNAQKVLKSGMIIRDIWDKVGHKVMDDPDPQPEPEQKPEQDPGGPVLG